MINPETQVTINDNTNNNINDEVTKKNKDAFIQKKPFIFKGYTNEKERIKEHIKNNQFLNGINEYDSIKTKKEKNKLFKNILKNNRHKIISPLSKLDLSNKSPSIDKSINLSQSNNISVIIHKLFPSNKLKQKYNLKSLFNSRDSKNKIIIKKIKSLSKEKNKQKNFQELNQITQYISKAKNMNQRKTLRKNFKSNENHELFNSYNYKLHFKAAEEIAENKMNKQIIENISRQEIYKNNLETKILLKNANIQKRLMESKNKKSEERYNQFKQKQNRFVEARIKSELEKYEKIKKLEQKQMKRDFNEINSKYKILNNQYDIFERNEKIKNNFNENYNIQKKNWDFLSQIK